MARVRLLAITALVLVTGCSSDPAATGGEGGAGAQGGSGGIADGGQGGIGGLGGAGGVGGEGGTGGMGGMGGAGGGLPPCRDAGPLGVELAPPATLSATGLYDDIATATLSSLVQAYQPRFPLWSDGADKERFVYLPPCPIDTSDMDVWSVPVGTRLWKAFRVGATLIETRLIHRFGEGPDDFWYATYAWDAAQMEATLVTDGVTDALGTSHDIPNGGLCLQCHQAAPQRVLSLSAIQLSHDGPGLTLDGLQAAGQLSAPPPPIALPGDATAQAALGYLHSNCGNCHNPAMKPFTFFSLQLSVADATVEATDAYQESVGEPALASFGGATLRIAPGDPSASVVSYRMGQREPFVQMPPVATDVVDDTGLAAVDAWIASLPP